MAVVLQLKRHAFTKIWVFAERLGSDCPILPLTFQNSCYQRHQTPQACAEPTLPVVTGNVLRQLCAAVTATRALIGCAKVPAGEPLDLRPWWGILCPPLPMYMSSANIVCIPLQDRTRKCSVELTFSLGSHAFEPALQWHVGGETQ